jgi:hypothetical protein
MEPVTFRIGMICFLLTSMLYVYMRTALRHRVSVHKTLLLEAFERKV